LLEVQLSTMLLPVAVAPKEIVPVETAELEEEDTTELDGLLDEATEGTELDDLLDGAIELDGLLEEATEGTELDEGVTLEELLPLQAAAVSCALFLPTPA
jgi:hypothetical protein